MDEVKGLENTILNFTYGKKSPSHQVCTRLIKQVKSELGNLGYQSLDGNIFANTKDKNVIYCYGLNFNVDVDPCARGVFLTYGKTSQDIRDFEGLINIVEDNLHKLSRQYDCVLDIDSK